jgi:hypothetical protein
LSWGLRLLYQRVKVLPIEARPAADIHFVVVVLMGNDLQKTRFLSSCPSRRRVFSEGLGDVAEASGKKATWAKGEVNGGR